MTQQESLMKIRRYSLSIHIGTLFIVLTTLFGAILIFISYHHAHQLLTSTAKELSIENSKHIENEFKKNAAPIFTTLDLLSYSSLVNGNNSPVQNTSWLASSHSVFKKNKHLVALYFANDNGDFIIIRPLPDHLAKKQFAAPKNAVLLINETTITGRDTYIYLDSEYQEIFRTEKQGNKFDPRKRPWFKNAQLDGELRLTDPYFFYFLKTTGVTLSRRTPDGMNVVAADFTLSSLSESLKTLGYSQKTKLVLFDKKFNVLGQKNTSVSHDMAQRDTQNLLEASVFHPILNRINSQIIYKSIEKEGEEWSLTSTPVMLSKQVSLILAEATPTNDLLTNLLELRNKQMLTAIGLLLISFFIVIIVARKIARPLHTLITLSENIACFEFKKTHYPKSMIKEVANLSHSLQLMEHTLYDLLTLLRKTTENTDFTELAKNITHQSYLVTRAETIILYIWDKDKQSFITVANHAIIPFKIEINELINTPWLKSELLQGKTVHINKHDNIIKKYDGNLYNSDIYLFPLIDKHMQLVGILNLSYERAITKDQSDKHAFLKELLSFAQLAKENIDRIQQHKDMMNSFIEIIASAIDTKSPYTGNHCQRIPLLAKWITEAAHNDPHYFPKFTMSDQQWEELKLASWLHDCGKIITPEFVIDKATKLETVSNRIHEIRMRFEVIKRQYEVDYWKKISHEGESTELKNTLQQQLKTLDQEFEFVAKCNVGCEKMNDTNIIKLNEIAKRTWVRTLDNQIGISWAEQQRYKTTSSIPIEEKLLDNKPEHILPWDKGRKPQNTWQEPFTLQPSDVLYNRGELYNLSVKQGTLTKEERFIVNDHIVQTISMLKKLPYPPHLKHVPDIAGSHHERVDGKGYPRSLSANELSIQARCLAMADVFESLTSNDRPYKGIKSLSEAIDIMTDKATSGHLDPKLYLLFLEQHIDDTFAKKFMDKNQINDIERERHIKKTKNYIRQKMQQEE